MANKLWTIPAERMKANAEHVVPIHLRAWDVLGRVHRRDGSPYIFTGQGREPVSDTAMRTLLRTLGVGKEVGTLHGFRSSFRTWCS